jgi:lysophospholipase L1-like esterase
MKKILLVGDSISMVRPKEEILFQDLYIIKLNVKYPCNIIVNAALRSNDTRNILKEHFLNEYVIPLSPDIVILQLGIVDASPRIFTKNEKLILSILSKSRIMNPLARKIIEYRSKRRYKFTKNKSFSYVPLEDFKKNLELFLFKCKELNPNVQFIVVNICKPGKFMIERNFGIDSQIINYNKALSDFSKRNNFQLIDTYLFTSKNSETILPDGYHISAMTHLFLYDELCARLRSVLY